MPDQDWKSELGNDRLPQRTWLKMPGIGMESEFNVWLDEVEIIPEKFWKHPSAFIDAPLLKRTEKSSQLPTGGAVYFDRGVIEVVTPVIELAPGCSARVVRNLWEQIGFVRDQLTQWGHKTGHSVRLKAYSSHFNISFELTAEEQSPSRNIRKLALLLAYILPVPAMLVGANRRSTGVGVRPRGNRIEVTLDFTPDPGLMIATATLIVGIVREVMSWPSYELFLLDKLPIPTVADVIPGKHTTRKGWLTKDFHYPRSPYTSNVEEPLWKARDGRIMSLRQMAYETAWFFRHSIRRHSDPFSFRLLFAVLEGRSPSMLELVDRPTAYEDVGRLCRWGLVTHELKSYHAEMSLMPVRSVWHSPSIDEYAVGRTEERLRHLKEMDSVGSGGELPPGAEQELVASKFASPIERETLAGTGERARRPVRSPQPAAVLKRRKSAKSLLSRRGSDTPGRLIPRRGSAYLDRRRSLIGIPPLRERRDADRRDRQEPIPFPDRRLTRSAYEQVFLRLVSGGRLKIGSELYTPIGMKGWYHAIFRRDSDGSERLLTIDQLLSKMSDWQETKA